MSGSNEGPSLLLHLLYYASELEELLGARWRSFNPPTKFFRQGMVGTPDTPEELRRYLSEFAEGEIPGEAASLIRRLLRESRLGGPPLSPRVPVGHRSGDSARPALDLGKLNELRRQIAAESDPDRLPGLGPAPDSDLMPFLGRPPRQRPRPIGVKGSEETAVGPPASAPPVPDSRLPRASAPGAPPERRISAWIGEREEVPFKPLQAGRSYALRFKIGSPVAASLIDGPAGVVTSSEVPSAGLETHWVVSSPTVELAPLPGEVEVSATALDEISGWKASFSLFLPKDGETAVPKLRITPRSEREAALDVVIYARQEIYRRLTIRLPVGRLGAASSATLVHEICDSPEAHLDLRTSHEWTTPPGVLTLAVLGNQAFVRGAIGEREEVEDVVPWFGADPQIASAIVNVRAAAEKLRRTSERYLNAIDPADLLRRLDAFQPQYEWDRLQIGADPAHEADWEELADGAELRELAIYGYNLYNAFFPKGRSRLRDWLDALRPGHRLNVSWLREGGAGWLAHVPWGLMHRVAPRPGQPVDAMDFLGLRLRIDYSSHSQVGSKALGRMEDIFHAHLMYWGDDAPTGPESQWQRALWQDWGKSIFVPPLPVPANAKSGLVDLLEASSSSPLALLYLFCNCSVGDGNEPVLRFANSNQPSVLLRQTELGLSDLPDKPLVFANACTTASADPYFANELATNFFSRGCRAFLGTETKVPIELASRFAAIFFQFFFRKVDPDPIAAGEAVAQTRLFLWTQYRNLGGLFYTYVNRYELFMARDDEVAALRS